METTEYTEGNANFSILYYENARSLRQGNANDQVTALNYYWQAVALAQADAFLTGKLSVR